MKEVEKVDEGDQRIKKYVDALEKSSVKDIQAMFKKIDDPKER